VTSRHTRPLAVALLLAAVAAPLGCIRGTIPARELYRLHPDSASVASTPPSRTPVLAGSLGIAPYVTPGIYAEPSIAYRIGEGEYGTYPSREWAIPVGSMLGVMTEEVLRRSPLSSSPAVFNPPSLRTQTYLWRGRVREFEEVDRGKVVSAAVWIDASLLRTADDSVVWSGTARRERVVSGSSMNAVVAALSAAARDALGQLASDADAALRGQPAATAGARN